MEFSHKTVCRELLLDLISYERYRGHLSPEIEYILERHLEQCPSCRRGILGYQNLLENKVSVPNFG